MLMQDWHAESINEVRSKGPNRQSCCIHHLSRNRAYIYTIFAFGRMQSSYPTRFESVPFSTAHTPSFTLLQGVYVYKWVCIPFKKNFRLLEMCVPKAEQDLSNSFPTVCNLVDILPIACVCWAPRVLLIGLIAHPAYPFHSLPHCNHLVMEKPYQSKQPCQILAESWRP